MFAERLNSSIKKKAKNEKIQKWLIQNKYVKKL